MFDKPKQADLLLNSLALHTHTFNTLCNESRETLRITAWTCAGVLSLRMSAVWYRSGAFSLVQCAYETQKNPPPSQLINLHLLQHYDTTLSWNKCKWIAFICLCSSHLGSSTQCSCSSKSISCCIFYSRGRNWCRVDPEWWMDDCTIEMRLYSYEFLSTLIKKKKKMSA